MHRCPRRLSRFAVEVRVVAPGEIIGDLSIEDRRIIEQRVATAAAARCGVCNSVCHSAAQELPEGNAGGTSLLKCGIFQTRRQDHGGSKHNYEYIIA
jgi:hypothetical protein